MPPLLLPMRKQISEALYLLVYLVTFYNRIEAVVYGGLAGELSEIIGDVMTVVKARQTRNSQCEETPVEEEGDSVEE